MKIAANYNPKHRRQHYTHPRIRAWNDACIMLARREKAMLRAAGVYTPGKGNYPMPEPGTQDKQHRIGRYFAAILDREHARIEKDRRLYATVYGFDLD